MPRTDRPRAPKRHRGAGSVYARGNRLWLRHKDASGHWTDSSTGLLGGQETLAWALLEKVNAQVASGAAQEQAAAAAPLTVAAWYERWKTRAALKKGWATHEGRFRLYVLPALGHLALTEVRPLHLRQMLAGLSDRGTLSQRTMLQAYRAARQLLRAAERAELIVRAPELDKDEIPRNVDSDPTWRQGAVFTRAEVETLISDARVPASRRLLVALQALAGLRVGEATALRWQDWEPAEEPLGRIMLWITKAKKVRAVPVHPTLAAMLAEWKLAYAGRYGHEPQGDDLVLPGPAGRLSLYLTRYRYHRDLRMLGLRKRRQHDLRRTFITLARSDGARRDVLEAVTHGERGGIVDVYTTWPWATLCEAVACLRVERQQRGVVVEVQALAAEGGGGGLAAILAASDTGTSEDRVLGSVPQRTARSLSVVGSRTVSRGIAPVMGGDEGDGGAVARTASDGAKRVECSKCSKAEDAARRALDLLEKGDVAGAAASLREVVG